MRRSENAKKLLELQKYPRKIRNMCILAHVDHGKTTLADALVASNGIISQRLAGKLRYMDSREDEQLRGITMKSSSIALHFEKDQEDYLVNLIDSPGHIDFASEVSTAVRLCDGAIIVIDVVEGICPQTYAALRQAWHENLKPVLVLNKIDRLIIELKLSPLEAYNLLVQVLEQANAITGELFFSDVHEKTSSRTTSDFVSPEERFSDWDIGLDDIDDSHLYFMPDFGNVVFASAIDGWGFCVEDFATMFASKVGISKSVLKKTLWGDFYLNSKAKRIQKGARDKGKKPLFVQFVLENLWSVYEAVSIRKDIQKIEKIVSSLGLNVAARDIKHKDQKQCLTAIFSQWLPVSRAVLSMIVDNLPSPSELKPEKVEGLMCHRNRKFDSLHLKTQELKTYFQNCNAVDVPAIVYVSKMLPFDRKSLPQNRPTPLTPEEIEARRDLARKRHIEMQKKEDSDIAASMPAQVDGGTKVTFSEPVIESVHELKQDAEQEAPVFIAFARIYSGTLKKGMKLFVLGPKHDPKVALESVDGDSLDTESRASSVKHVTISEIGNLYMLMGRELEELDEVPAGNIIGISGLEEHILKSATLSTTIACPAFTEMMYEAVPIVRVAVDPENPVDMPHLVKGMKLLNQADPCVEVRVQDTGEHVIIAAGEVHLQRCVDDLKLRYANIELNVSAPIVPFRETIVKPPEVDMVNEVIQNQLQSAAAEYKSEKDCLIEVMTTDKTTKIAIRAKPLPEEVVRLLVDNADLLKTLNKFSWQYQKMKNRKGTMNEVSRNELIQFRTKLNEAFVSDDKCWEDTVSRIWCFGPHHRGPNILVNSIEDYERPSVWHILEENEAGNLREFDNSIVSGFQIATRSGPLCEEPMMGVCYLFESWNYQPKVSKCHGTGEDEMLEVDGNSPIEMRQDSIGSGATSGQLISCMKEACRKAFQARPQRLMAAMYACEIQANCDVLGKLYAVIGKRNGRIVYEDLKEGSAAFIIKALIPVADSFGFAEDIRKKTSGLAIPQLKFSHWETIETDPFWVPTTEEEYLHYGERADSENQARKYMNSVRRRKGLVVDEQIVECAEKQRTLSKNK